MEPLSQSRTSTTRTLMTVSGVAWGSALALTAASLKLVLAGVIVNGGIKLVLSQLTSDFLKNLKVFPAFGLDLLALIAGVSEGCSPLSPSLYQGPKTAEAVSRSRECPDAK